MKPTRPPALFVIDAYRRHLSPHKGFRCASGVLHGNGSCSDVVRAIVDRRGVFGGWGEIRAQFRTCRQAAAELKRDADEENQEPNPEGKRSWRQRRQERRQTATTKFEVCADLLTFGLCVPDPTDCGLGLAGESLGCGGEAASGICSCL